MAAPTPYELSYDFTAFQAATPTLPLPADKIEIEFNNLEITTDEIITNLGLIQKSDGTLANGIVKTENLATELTIGLNSPTSWANGTVYAVNDTVIESNKLYRCIEAHTASVFATDLAANKWVLVADYAAFLSGAEDAQTAAEAAQTVAEAAQAAAEAVYDDFDDRYLGAKASDPTVDNDGDALVAGALYYNTGEQSMKVYTGTSWGDAIGATSLPVFVYTATGGETSFTGADDNSNVLSYTPGKVQVFINGSNETPNVVTTSGDTISGISPALSASDVVEIYSFQSVAVLEDISTHSTATPVKEDFLLFQDINDSDLDRRATIEDIILVDNVIPQADSGVISASDFILFADESAGNATKQDTVQGILDLVPDSELASGDIVDQTDAVLTVNDEIVFADASDSNNLKKDTIQGILDLVPDLDIAGQSDTVITASDEIIFADDSDSDNLKKDTVQGILDLVTVPSTYGAVSTYVFAAAIGGGAIASGGTIAGSNLRPAAVADGTAGDNTSADIHFGGSALSGTWRNMGDAVQAASATAGKASLWVRIS
jgi:hypothetical protein